MARRGHDWDPRCPPPRGLVRPVPLDPDGRMGPTRGQAKGPRWRQTSHGLYVPATVATTPEQRVLEASMLLPPGGAVTGWAALRLWGGRFFDGLGADGVTFQPVPLVTGPGVHLRPRPGVTFLRDRISPDEVRMRYGVPVTVPERAVFDGMRRAGEVRAAVSVVDRAAAAGLTSVRRVRAYVAHHPGWQGVGVARAAAELGDDDSWSPQETTFRLTWMLDARLPRPLANRELFDRRTGALLGVADLLDPDAGVVGEYDGGEHAGARRRSRDAARDGTFRDHGLEVFRVTYVDMLDPAVVVARARAAYRRARRRPSRERTWTLDPPPGREPSRSLDDDLDLDYRDLLRELHERWAGQDPG
ncbi:MAG: hypothetical protein ACTHOK_03545 [Nocardioidaceae bacterium]